jgi:hypothetical protein
MSGKFFAALTPLVLSLLIGAQTAPKGFVVVETGVEGVDFSALNERIEEAVKKARAPGAGEREKRAAAVALLERAVYFREAGIPKFYKFALGDFRHILRLEPNTEEVKAWANEIVGIYQSMDRPVPETGNTISEGQYVVELYKTTPKQIAFQPGRIYTDAGHGVTEHVAYVYEFSARAGQKLSVRLKPEGEGVPLLDIHGEGAGTSASVVTGGKGGAYVLPSEGKYLLRVYSKKDKTDYELTAELK